MNLQALIFDVDGTLADTERHGHRIAFNEAFARAGLNWNWNETLYGELLAVTGGKERIRLYMERFLPDFGPPHDPAAPNSAKSLDALIAELHKSKTGIYTSMLTEGRIPLRPGVRRLIRESSQAGLRLAIATTTTPENVTVLLESALGSGSTELFEIIAAGDIVPEKKPAPDIYDYVLDHLGLDASRVIAIEDSAHGLTSALSAGIQTIVTINDYTSDQDFSGATVVLDSLGEPDAPFHVIQGSVPDGSVCVDLALLHYLHDRDSH